MIRGNILNVFTSEIYPAEIALENGAIKCVKPVKEEFKDIILPGFIDSHIHIESSLLTPSRFAEVVVPHGTTSVVADPHEIANVLGVPGIEYMIKDASSVPLNFFFTVPSCVPATPFETSGGVIDSREVDGLLKREDFVALGEMMNFPGVLSGDAEVTQKIESAQHHGKPVDGHAPLLSGDELCSYVRAGISTDHECTTLPEAVEKRKLGMKVMLRQGSSAHNLKDLLPEGDFIVSDDKHPEDLIKGHVNLMLKQAVDYGLDPVEAVKMVTINPSNHYCLNKGAITPGKSADLVIVDGLKDFNVKKVYIKGKLVSTHGKPLFPIRPVGLANTFHLGRKVPADFEITSPNHEERVRVIEALPDQLLTNELETVLNVVDGKIMPDTKKDVLKISVVERYGHNQIFNGFTKGFNLKIGAIASSIAHDSHNIVVVGSDTVEMADSVNRLTCSHGGLVAVAEDTFTTLQLPIAGLMSDKSAFDVSSKLKLLHEQVRSMGCTLDSPFMTLSFMALLVIPSLKISDKGLFDVEKFQFVDVVKNNRL